MSETRAKLIYLHALTPVHSGTGQAAAVIDLPIAREKATGWPMIPASSLKGVLRDAYERRKTDEFVNSSKPLKEAKELAEAKAKEVFGDSDKAGALVFGDQRIVCLPVRSYFGTFAYITCPLVLQRLKRDAEAIGVKPPFDKNHPSKLNEASGTKILLPSTDSVLSQGTVYLEDLDLQEQKSDEARQIAEGLAGVLFQDAQDAFIQRFGIVSDEVFNFLSETATEVVARIALGEDGTTSGPGGNLWYEEAVPAEAIFAGPVMIADHFGKNGKNGMTLQALWNILDAEKTVQIGGNASVGRGLCRVVIK